MVIPGQLAVYHILGEVNFFFEPQDMEWERIPLLKYAVSNN